MTRSQQNNEIEFKKLKDINRRLNDLLNQKDDEILQLSNKLFDKEGRVGEDYESPFRNKSRISKMSKSPARRPPLGAAKTSAFETNQGSADYDNGLRDKLRESERQVAELKQELKSLQRIQV